MFEEFLAGGSLREAIVKHLLSPTEKLIILYGISAGMQSIHNRSLVHRDLKPENVMLDSRRHPRIVDLGLCRNVQRDMTENLGTLLYLDPCAHGDRCYDEKVDIYSYSIILYELITSLPNCPKNFQKRQKVWVAQVIGGRRLCIPETVSERSRSLIESCWSEDVSGRPSFREICSSLRESPCSFLEGVDCDAFEEYCSMISS